jgi:hypothetical protein
MATTTPVIRGGPVLAALALLAVASPAGAGDAARRYTMHASLRPVVTKTTARGDALSMQASLVASRSYVPVQEGGDLALIGKLAHVVLGCADDTIFANGFDGPI